jgi:hypothetical protein
MIHIITPISKIRDEDNCMLNISMISLWRLTKRRVLCECKISGKGEHEKQLAFYL